MEIKYVGRTKVYNDTLFLGAYLEYIARHTKHKKIEIIDFAGEDFIHSIYEHADANHCLTFDQHLYEFQEEFNMPIGTYDDSDKYNGLSVQYITVAAKPVANMIDYMKLSGDEAFHKFIEIHRSWFADILFDWSTALYRQPAYYLVGAYNDGYVDFDDYPSVF